MKKYLFLIIILFLIIVGFATAVYFWLNVKNAKTSEAIQAIPIDASIIVKVEDFTKLNALQLESNVWESINEVNFIGEISTVFSFIDSLNRSSSLVKTLLANNSLYAALCTEVGGKTSFLFSIKIPEGINSSDIYSLSKLQAIGLYREEEKYFNKTSILNFKKGSEGFENLALATNNGILLVSNSSLLIEKSLSQLDNSISLIDNPQFVAISKTSGSRVDANVFVNLKYLPQLIKQPLNDKYSNGASTLGDVAQWIELDLTLAKNKLVMSGLSTVSDSTNSFLRLLSKQKPIDIEMTSVLPVETGLFVWMGITSLNDYLEGYRSYLDRKGEIFKYTQNLSSYRNLIGAEVQDYFETIINEEVGVVFLPSVNPNTKDDWYIVSKTKSYSASKQYLQKVSENFSKETHTQNSTKPITIKIDKEKSVEIYHQPLQGLYSVVFGSLFRPVLDNYYCFIDNWIIWGASPEALERYVKSNIRNTILHNNLTYKQFSGELPKKANYFVYINPSIIDKVTKEFIVSGKTQIYPLNKLHGISYQLIGGNNLIFNTLTITSGEQLQSVTQKGLWETKLDAIPTIKPQIVINHTNKEKEIFVQDSENNIYLINSIGRILWKRKLDGSIMGEITQVDIFKNRKLQFAFNSGNKLFVVDRNGKDVPGFPILYSAPATNPVSVIDYDGSRDYRFFQACSDRKIYTFDSKGKQIKGWKFNKTESTVIDRVGFVRVGGLDYIIVFDSNRPYILNRKGEERVKLKQYFSKATNSSYSLGSDKNGKAFITTTDTIGLIRNLYLDGNIEDIALQSFTRWHSYINQDLNGDGKKDYIFLDNNTITAFNHSKDKLFQLKIKDDLKPDLLFFDFGGKNKIGVVSEKSNKIYLIDTAGKIEESFPHNGSTPFSISKISPKNNSLSLIAGSKQGTIINYGLNQ